MIQAGEPHQTEAIVLRVLDYGESDRIVTFFTHDFGKIRGIAKGARKSRKRFANALEPFSCLRIQFTRKRPESLALISACDVLAHFSGIRGDLEKTLAASYMIDLADHFTPEDKKNDILFALLHDFLLFLDGTVMSDSLLRFFEIRLLKIAGYDPVLSYCLRCKTPVGKQKAYLFDAAKGGLVCEACGQGVADAVGVSLGTIRTLQMGGEMEIDRLGRLILSVQSADESRRLLAHFIRHILGRELKSVHVLNEIRRLGI
jgi:DNA repair protein RecO (recombination protein O)